MTKARSFSRSLLVFACALAASSVIGALWAEVPPPPAFEPGALEAPPAPGAPEAPPAPGAADTGFAPAAPASASGEGAPAAPSIDDAQLIKNALDIALQQYRAQDFKGSAKDCAAILERYPDRKLYWVRYLYALSLEHQKLYAEAEAAYKRVVEEVVPLLPPPSGRSGPPGRSYADAARLRAGLCEMKSGQVRECVFTLRDIIDHHPSSAYRVQAFLHLGELYRSQQDWKSAGRVYRDLIRDYPSSTWAWSATLCLAETYARSGRNAAAVRVYESLLKDRKAPEAMQAQAQLAVGDLHVAERRWLEALQVYEAARRVYASVPGMELLCEQKIALATKGRKEDKLSYRRLGPGPLSGQSESLRRGAESSLTDNLP